MDAESGSRTLHAAADLVELLRLAQSAAERLGRELHGAAFEQAELIGRDIHALRSLAEKLQAETEKLVSREESASVSRGHPLRRASDRR
jgi:hypothetical protein